jgi:hypothetical protein
LFAIAILIPIYVAIALASPELDLPDYSSALGGAGLFSCSANSPAIGRDAIG